MERRFIIIALLALCMGARMPVLAQTYSELVDSAYAALERDDLSRAADYVKRAIEADPGNERNVLLFANLGSIQHQQGQLKEAAESYSLALNYKPTSMPILLARAATYLELGAESKAYIDYCNVLDQDIENHEALTFRAYIAVHQRMYDVARADYGRLLALDPKDAGARFGLAMLNQKQERLAEATEQLSSLIQDFPKEPDYLIARANVLTDRELYDLALLDMETALKLTPQDPYVYATRAAIYLRMGRHKRQARADLDHAVQLGLSRADLADLYNKL
ncbi:MAG: tetratricopeptide repeat protein [Bacteroidaceae bacterium]|nr:tetratricopeptide repeat protein [Bacteroidaceae bacterium]